MTAGPPWFVVDWGCLRGAFLLYGFPMLIIIPGLSRKVRLSLLPVRLPPLRWDNMRMIRSEPWIPKREILRPPISWPCPKTLNIRRFSVWTWHWNVSCPVMWRWLWKGYIPKHSITYILRTWHYRAMPKSMPFRVWKLPPLLITP